MRDPLGSNAKIADNDDDASAVISRYAETDDSTFDYACQPRR
ncbi:hypothetical protein [Humisphaera borealis]|nr:hypothetical protein [Humisphaera borealis]